MKLSTVLGSIKGTESGTKVASASAPADTAPTKTAAASQDALKAALKEVTSAPAAAEKQASASSPVADLMKTAAQVAGAESEALLKEANWYGAAVCDGFMARFAQYNEAAEKLAAQHAPAAPVKTAADSFDKFAAENPQLVREAAELGYGSTIGQMDKLAGAAYEKGYNQAVEQIYKLAHGTFCRGYEDTLRMATEARR